MVNAAFGLETTIVSVEMPFCAIDGGEKFLVISGLAMISTAATAGWPGLPDSSDETPDVVLVLIPPVVPMTSTVMVHVPNAGIVPPLKFNAVSPAIFPGITVPMQVFANAGVGAICRPAGNASVNATLVIGSAKGLLIVMVMLVGTFCATCAAPNALVMPGLPTESVAVALKRVLVVPLKPIVEMVLI